MTYKNILNKLEGKWTRQTTNCFIYHKQASYDQKTIKLKQIHNIHISQKEDNIVYHYQLHNPENNQKTYYLFSKKKQSEFGELHKITNDRIKYYRFKIYTHNCIKIESVKERVVYYEYIYFVNPKFKITLSVLKENQKYLAISFISEIRISN
uniref:Chromophore lyase CpcS/CpeS n=1 Tax=Gracilaria textorii TaxID=172949 RepID=A0A6C0A9X0_9FLOR|nr:hypothetical protein [Gracilaria textorii]QHS70962.1 hypothetical protein [Gracilaria textorii]